MRMSSFIVAVLATCCTGCCSDNLYYEHDAIGLDLTVPIFGQRYGVTIGSVKSTSTAVRGGTSFDSESASGVGLNGSATTTRKTTFRANAQLNEKNIVKVMESPNVDIKAKTALAKQLGDGVVAPDFQPTAMRTRDGVIYANGYRGSHIPNDFSATGIDKIIEDTAGVINGATDAIVFITSDIDITMQEVYDVTNEIRNASSSEIDIVIGTGFNADLQGELIVTVIATGFDGNQEQDNLLKDEATLAKEAEERAKKLNDTSFISVGGSNLDIDPNQPKKKREKGESIPEWLKNRFK